MQVSPDYEYAIWKYYTDAFWVPTEEFTAPNTMEFRLQYDNNRTIVIVRPSKWIKSIWRPTHNNTVIHQFKVTMVEQDSDGSVCKVEYSLGQTMYMSSTAQWQRYNISATDVLTVCKRGISSFVKDHVCTMLTKDPVGEPRPY